MGLSVAISGGIILTVFVLLLLSLPGLTEKMFSIGDITTQVTQHEQEISNTEISISNLSVLVGSSRVNFTLNNDGSEKLWNFKDFDLFIEYNGAISGKRTEQISYSGECPGTVPPAGNWCIDSISNDVADPKILNSGEKANIRTTLSQNLVSKNVIVTVVTDNGVTFTTGRSLTNEGIPKPTQASPKKWGELQPTTGALTVDGLLAGGTLTGAASYAYNATYNSGQMQLISGAVAGNNAGLAHTTAGQDVYRQDQNSYMLATVGALTINANRMFIGFQSSTTPAPNAADNVVNVISAAGICLNVTSTTYNFCSNDGVGVGNYLNTGVTEDGAIHTFEIYAEETNNRWCVKVDGGAALCNATAADIPAATTRLFENVQIETADASADTFRIIQVYVENDR